MKCGIIYTDEPEKNGSVLNELINTQEKFKQLEDTVNSKIESIDIDFASVKEDIENNSIAINELSLKPAITKITESGNVLNINSGMTVENNGDVAVGKDLDVDGNIVVNNLDNLRDKDGNSVADIKNDVQNNSIAINTLSLKPAITKITESGNVLNINSGITVENNGDVAVGKDLDVDGNIVVNDLDNLRDKDGNSVADIKSDVNLLGQQIVDDQNYFKQLSNPNLLINGDFRINQRGQNSYTGNEIYTVDRWQLTQSNSSCNVSSNKVAISFSQQYSKFRQVIENFNFLKGKQVTISAKVSNYVHNRTFNTVFELDSGVDENIRVTLENGIISATGTFNANATKCEINFYNFGTGIEIDSFDVEWVKLEVGEIATPFNPRPYEEELAMCQRYYQIFKPANNTAYFAIGSLALANTFVFMLATPTTLRTTPTITNSGSLRIWGYNLDISSSSYSLLNARFINNSVFFSISANSSSQGTVAYLRANSDNTAKIELDAEIY